MSTNKTLLFRVGDFAINGLICSANKWYFGKKQDAKKVNCEDKIYGN